MIFFLVEWSFMLFMRFIPKYLSLSLSLLFQHVFYWSMFQPNNFIYWILHFNLLYFSVLNFLFYSFCGILSLWLNYFKDLFIYLKRERAWGRGAEGERKASSRLTAEHRGQRGSSQHSEIRSWANTNSWPLKQLSDAGALWLNY